MPTDIDGLVAMNDRTITEVTRRSIVDALLLNQVHWSGRLAEDEFLTRLYNLSDMPATDYRFADAGRDIWQHRVRNLDWGDEWVFYDRRFNLLYCPDEEFLRFLCEMLHPSVQPDSEDVERIRRTINGHLIKDEWEIRAQMEISGRPVFGAFRTIGADLHTAEAARVVAQSIDSTYVNRQITRMQTALSSDPEAAIGTAKEFVETVCKTILGERSVAYDGNEKVPRLAKQVAAALELVPKAVAGEEKATETIKRLLTNLATVADGLAELRNRHGTGHGKEACVEGLALRHAWLAVGAATALAVFLWETPRGDQTVIDSGGPPKPAPPSLRFRSRSPTLQAQ
jgi:hypothetical protein